MNGEILNMLMLVILEIRQINVTLGMDHGSWQRTIFVEDDLACSSGAPRQSSAAHLLSATTGLYEEKMR